MENIIPFIYNDRWNFENTKMKYKNRYISNIIFFDNTTGEIIINVERPNFIHYNNEKKKDYKILRSFYPKCEVKIFNKYIDSQKLLSQECIILGKNYIPHIIQHHNTLWIPIQLYKPTLIDSYKHFKDKYYYKIIDVYEIELLGSYEGSDINVKNQKILFDTDSKLILTKFGEKLKILSEIGVKIGVTDGYDINIKHIDAVIQSMSNVKFRKIFNELLRKTKIENIL